MTGLQKAIKYAAIVFAIFLIVSIIGGIVSTVFTLDFLFGDKEELAGDTKTYDITDQVTALKMDIGAAEIRIVTDPVFRVESNHTYLSVEEKNGTLSIYETQRLLGVTAEGVTVTLYIPEGTVFRLIDIDTGAGVLTADTLSAETLYMDFGAGKVEINTLNASAEAQINGGAGKVTVSGGALHDLDADMGAGEMTLKAKLTGDGDFDCGMGSTDITLIGTAAEYSVEIDKGLGDITVDGKSVRSGQVFGTGENEIDIDGGMGKIAVRFAAE